MAEDEKKFLLRLPPRLFEELRRWAEQDLRSINGQIEFLLREAVARRKKSAGPATESAPPADSDGPTPS